MLERMLRYYFDVVCPYSYLLMPEVEAAEDAGTPVEWVPFELRPAPAELPEPRGRYIRDHWRDHVYPLALAYGIEIHVPVYQPRSTLALAAGLWAEDQGAGRAWRDGVQRAWEPASQARLRALRDHAMAIGVHGVPSLAVDDKSVFFGAPPPGAVASALAGWDGDAAELAARLRAI